MERRHFLGTSLLLTASGCATASRPSRSAAPVPRGGGPVRLSSNENPLGLSPAARRALLDDLNESHRYPRQKRTDMIAALAQKHGVAPEQVQLGAGSTEILQMAVQNTPPDTLIVLAEPTYEDVARYANATGRRVVSVPIRADGSHDIPRMRAAAGSGPALVFVCNPNNPTGTLTACDEVDAWIGAADERTTFLVDEAYFEFVEDSRYRSAQHWLASKPNVLVVRTFSKIYGMAGLRLGYALGQAATITRLRLQACQNNANELALAAGLAALGDTDFHQRTIASNRAARQILHRTLDQLGLRYLPSHTNFVMHQIRGGLTEYNDRMREAGFLVGRAFPPMLEYSRVSLGLPDEMELFTAALRDFRARGWI